MIKVFVVEDQAMVRGALCALLQMEDGIEVVGQAENGQKAWDRLPTLDIDILLTDIEMPELTGIELAEKSLKAYPNIHVIIVTTFARVGYIKRALTAGVKGFLLKDAPSEELAQALHRIKAGKKVIDPELAIAALDDCDPLSNKERQALRLAGEGQSTAEISKRLFLSEGTVRNYLSEAISKLNASNRIDAARIARQKGWL